VEAAASSNVKSPGGWLKGLGKQVVEYLAREIAIDQSDLMIAVDGPSTG
jgi:hypothetical protein